MSTASSWLQKQRKTDLIELADLVGYTDYDGLKKAEIEVALDEYLSKNESRYASEPRLQPFYKRRGDSASSPVKKEAPSSTSVFSDVDTKVKAVKRRVTKAAEEIAAAATTTDDSDGEPAASRARTALTRTPRASGLSNLQFAANMPLPPSPAVVADAIDRRTAVLRGKLSSAYEESGIIETTHATRETLSTIFAVESLVVGFELFNLRKELLADRYAFTLPAIGLLGSDPYPVKIPDLFLLLTSSFWSPALLWAVTTLILPLTAAYFVNLSSSTRRADSSSARTTRSSSAASSSPYAYAFDPFTFNIVKGLLVFIIFGQDKTFGGLVDLEDVARINSAVFGGYQGVLVGNAIGLLMTLYDAAQK